MPGKCDGDLFADEGDASCIFIHEGDEEPALCLGQFLFVVADLIFV